MCRGRLSSPLPHHPHFDTELSLAYLAGEHNSWAIIQRADRYSSLSPPTPQQAGESLNMAQILRKIWPGNSRPGPAGKYVSLWMPEPVTGTACLS
jgi:hypothetical protein